MNDLFEISVIKILKDIWPALFVLLLTLVISVFFTQFTFVTGLTAMWMVLLRFVRLLIVLSLPLLFISPIFFITGKLLNVGNWKVVQIKEERTRVITPLQNWFLRPLQGIGFSMLIATKLIILLGIYTGSGVNESFILPPATFHLSRFLTITAIAFAISILLSALWGLDDFGIRLYNHKTKEIRMIGRYIGVLLPIFFGFYGMLGIFQKHSQMLAIQYIIQMIVILYPPFLIFNVFHAYYIEKKKNLLLDRLNVNFNFVLSDINK
jgi:hypothetical protein